MEPQAQGSASPTESSADAKDSLSGAKRQLLDHLKRQGASTVGRLAELHGSSEVAVRQHLKVLEEQDWVERRRRSQAQTSLAIAAGLAVFRKNPLLATALAAGAAAVLGRGAGTGKSRRDD